MSIMTRDLFSAPRNIALCSLFLMGLFHLLVVFFANGATTAQVENWASVAVVGTLIYLAATSVAVHKTVVHTYVFFLACTGLFVGGRYVAHAIGYDPMDNKWPSTMFSVNMPYFIVMSLTSEEALRLTSYIVTCLLSLHAGYMFAIAYRGISFGSVDSRLNNFLKFPALILAILSFSVFLISFPEVYHVAHTQSYTSIYKGSADFTTRGSTAAQYGLLLALGLAFASKIKWLSYLTLCMLGIYYAASMSVGVRGGMMGFALLFVWVVHTQIRPINRFAIIAIPVLMAALMFLSSFGVRDFHFGEHASNLLPWFIDNQGHTALYIFSATQVDSYPAIAYLHSMFPVAPMIAKIIGLSIPLDELYFGQYLSKLYLVDGAYQNGNGMGWSLFADFYAYSLGVPLLYIPIALVFGAALSKLVNSTNTLVFGAHVMLFVKIMLLPRTGLYSIIPFVIAYLMILFISYVGLRFLSKPLSNQ
ncbi:hypothetical protein JWR97_09380 [Pseudomonas cedrina subsp. fulgida]|nr:hypothetical protein [Pseudomonas cedrina subsp. fulgida]